MRLYTQREAYGLGRTCVRHSSRSLGGNRGLGRSVRCLSCKHSLRGLAAPRCTECGRAFNPTDPRTFSPDLPGRSRPDLAASLLATAAAAICLGACFTLSFMPFQSGVVGPYERFVTWAGLLSIAVLAVAFVLAGPRRPGSPLVASASACSGMYGGAYLSGSLSTAAPLVAGLAAAFLVTAALVALGFVAKRLVAGDRTGTRRDSA